MTSRNIQLAADGRMRRRRRGKKKAIKKAGIFCRLC
jgi:hypothetical protein